MNDKMQKIQELAKQRGERLGIFDLQTNQAQVVNASGLINQVNELFQEQIGLGKTALVCGAGGFIGSHLVKRLKREGFWVRGVDLKYPEFSPSAADDFVIGDLRDQQVCQKILDRPFDEVYQLAADMGGAGYIFTGENDANVMHNSATINLNMAFYGHKVGIKKLFYSSSACMYPAYNQEDPDNPKCSEDTAYPAEPDSEYGWEKLFSERLYLAFARNYGLNVRIARFHNIFGPEGTWIGGKEKAPAAFCRKVAEAEDGGEIEMWGDGKQTRSFLYIDECIEGVRQLMDSEFTGPVNIGSEEMVTINELAAMIMEIANKKLSIKHIQGPLGVRGRNSDNYLIEEKLGWKPTQSLKEGLIKTYEWIEVQAKKSSQTKTELKSAPKLVIVSTTIHGEKGYLPFDNLAHKSKFKDVTFVIAGDLKSPPFDITPFKCAVEYLTPEDQDKYECSQTIGWNKIMRRNIALLRAIELDPDYILIIDDDNIPADDYFDKWYEVISQPCQQMIKPEQQAQGPYWHNYLATSDAEIKVYPRGFPIPFREQDLTRVDKANPGPISPDKIGVFQGISLGDPDIDAMTRIIYPKPLPLNRVEEKNYCLKDVWSSYNTQNTLFSKKLFPLAFVWPYCGRYDDIYSSFTWQKFLFNNDMYAHVGEAINRQDRGKRNDLKDLQNEVEGYYYSHLVWQEINKITATDPIEFIKALIKSDNPIILRQREFFQAYLKDLEKINK